MRLCIPRPDTQIELIRPEHVQGFLRACEAFARSIGDGGPAFDFDELPDASTPERAIAVYLRRRLGAEVKPAITVRPDEGGVVRLAERFLHFLFEMADAHRGKQPPAPQSEDARRRESVGQALVDLLVALVRRQPIVVHRVEVAGSDPLLYVDLQEEYCLEAGGARYLLSLTVNYD